MPPKAPRLQERDPHPAGAGHRRVAHRLDAALPQLLERAFEVLHLEGDVLDAGPSSLR